MLISDVLTQFLIKKTVEGITKSTYKYYKTQITYFINFWGDNNINTLTLNDYNNYILFLQNKYKESSGFKDKNVKFSTVSIKTYANALRIFLNWSYENKYLKTNIGKFIKLPRFSKKNIDILSKENITKLISLFNFNTFIGLRDTLVISLMLDAGLRLNEVTNLKINDINTTKNLIKVFGKGQKERFVPLTPFILDIYIKYISFYQNLFKRQLCANEQLIKSNIGTDINRNGISLIFRRLRKKVDFKLHPHLLRHTFATYFLLNGGEISTLMIILGHTTIRMTEHYVHLANQLNLNKQARFSPLSNI